MPATITIKKRTVHTYQNAQGEVIRMNAPDVLDEGGMPLGVSFSKGVHTKVAQAVAETLLDGVPATH